jgi:hypothetical protein
LRVTFFLDELGKDNPYLIDNFKRLQDAIEAEPVLKTEFKFFEIVVPAAVTRKSYPHRLPFQPKDAILLSATNDASVTFHFDDFTKENIVFTASDPCTFRCFIGAYREGILR